MSFNELRKKNLFSKICVTKISAGVYSPIRPPLLAEKPINGVTIISDYGVNHYFQDFVPLIRVKNYSAKISDLNT